MKSKEILYFSFFQIYACLMIFFISNAIEGQMISTGAFEVSLNSKFLIFNDIFVIGRPILSTGAVKVLLLK